MSFFLLILATFLGPIIASSSAHHFLDNITHFVPFNALPLSLHEWVSDGLMSLFFLTLSLEIKHAFTHGPLQSWKNIALPLCAAIGGMMGPALIALLIDYIIPTKNALSGWAIPTATDAAFTMPLLALIPKIPPHLRIFLIALAIFDDLGAIIILALFYGQTPHLLWLLLSLIPIMMLFLFSYFKIKNPLFYLFSFALLWFAFYQTGIEPTIAGVLLGFFLSDEMRDKIHLPLEKIVAFFILPIFAFLSTGIDVHLFSFDYFKNAFFLSAAIGLLLGKPIGISLTYLCATRTHLLPKLKETSFSAFMGVCFLCGIGFTMSLLITERAYDTLYALTAGRTGVLFGSILSAIIGFILLKKWEKHSS